MEMYNFNQQLFNEMEHSNELFIPKVTSGPSPPVTNLQPEISHYHHPVEARPSPPRKIAPLDQMTYTNPRTDPKMLQMEKTKELNKLKIELLKKKQTHYEELTKRQKEILSKLEKENITKEEKARLLKAFKHADVAVQKLRKELYEEAQPKTAVVVQPVQNFADATKAILDKEIDIYHGNLDGEELIEANKDLASLVRRQANFTTSSSFSTSTNFTSTGTRGRGAFRGRGRSSWYQTGIRGRGRGNYATLNIDNRPKQIIVSGYDLTQKDDVVAHFVKFGQLERIEEHEKNSMKLTFPTRKSAEIAAEQGANFQGKQLILSWFTQQATPTVLEVQQQQDQPAPTPEVERTVTRSLSQSLMDKDSDDDLLELDKEEEEMLLADIEDYDDDEDDDESEERSWKR